jgi:hypothetical protein
VRGSGPIARTTAELTLREVPAPIGLGCRRPPPPSSSSPAFDRHHLGVGFLIIGLVQIRLHGREQFSHANEPLFAGHIRDPHLKGCE